jgi:hypothetical protein
MATLDDMNFNEATAKFTCEISSTSSQVTAKLAYEFKVRRSDGVNSNHRSFLSLSRMLKKILVRRPPSQLGTQHNTAHTTYLSCPPTPLSHVYISQTNLSAIKRKLLIIFIKVEIIAAS